MLRVGIAATLVVLAGSAFADKPAPVTELAADRVFSDWATPIAEEDKHGLLTVCFDAANPPSPDFVEDLFNSLAASGVLGPGDDSADFFAGNAWGGSFGIGQPRVITWSFVPDGVIISNGAGEGSAASSLFSTMDSKFAGQGGRATWVARFEQSFARWSALTGIDYIRRKSGNNDWDDGAAWGSSGSTARGDVRISMKNIDGGGGILAYNYFPQNGDMVLDRSENWQDTANQNRFLRNVILHEHGHGIGLAHVCSSNQNFLMEPFLNTAFDGPQHDDLRGGQRQHADPWELVSGVETRDLGTLTVGTTLTNACNPPAPQTGSNPPNTTICSLHRNGDVDQFSFVVFSPATVSVTVSPVGFSYDNNSQAQNGSCPSGSTYNSATVADLAVQLQVGGIPVATDQNSGLGQSESVTYASAIPAAYTIRVYETNTPAQPQLYSLSITVSPAADALGCLGDLTDDTEVNDADLAIVLADYGCADEQGCIADLDGDGVTGDSDLGLILTNMGLDCQ